MTETARSIQPTDLFHIPKRRRPLRSMETGSEGQSILFLHYGLKELCFDDPRLMAFGEGLFQASQFSAGGV
ncbi:MAG: hypothetical protein ABI612_10975 [Betaproteobacteria bacterium]